MKSRKTAHRLPLTRFSMTPPPPLMRQRHASIRAAAERKSDGWKGTPAGRAVGGVGREGPRRRTEGRLLESLLLTLEECDEQAVVELRREVGVLARAVVGGGQRPPPRAPLLPRGGVPDRRARGGAPRAGGGPPRRRPLGGRARRPPPAAVGPARGVAALWWRPAVADARVKTSACSRRVSEEEPRGPRGPSRLGERVCPIDE